MKIGFIIGRFQVPQLHAGHKHIIDKVLAKSDRIVIMVGVTRNLKQDVDNPLDYMSRLAMIRETYGFEKVDVMALNDCFDDEDWDKSVDKILKHFERQGSEVTLYGSRRSFIFNYNGEYRPMYIEPYKAVGETDLSGTMIRQSLIIARNYDYRVGVIDTINKLSTK